MQDEAGPTTPVNPPPTRGRVAFDLLFGVVSPLICLVFDPIVFRSSTGGPGPYAVGAYAAAGVGMVVLTAWTFTRRRPALSAGLLAGGAAFAGLVGLALLPLSLLCVFIGIGLLGLTPLVTAFVFGRAAAEAFAAAGPSAWAAAVAGFALAVGGPAALQAGVDREVDRGIRLVRSDDPADVAAGVAALMRVGRLAGLDRVVFAYADETDPVRQARLAAAYRAATGEDAAHRLGVLRD